MNKVQATCAIIQNKDGKVLLVRRGQDPFAGYWALVSGIGETKKGLLPDEAILGEVDWDLGVKFEGRRVFVMPVENDDYVYETVVYVGKVEESGIRMNPPFTLEWKWVAKEEIREMGRMAFEHNEILDMFYGV